MPEKGTVKVLIVDDTAETRENIRRSLQFDADIEVVGTARNGKEAVSMAQELRPDVVIMDINMPDMDGITATELIRQKLPFTQVIILSVQTDLSYMRKAMLVGARDFLSKPPSIDELISTIHRAGKMAQEEQRKISKQTSVETASLSPLNKLLPSGKIITIYSPKGGVGKTTLASNLSLALLEGNNKVVLVDANMQFGDVAIFLNEQVKNNVLDLTPRVDELDFETLDDVLLKHTGSELRILASPPRPEMAEKVNSDEFGHLLEYLRQVYQYIIIDTTSYLTDFVQSVLDVSDLIILVTTQEIPAIKNVSLFLNLMDASGINRGKIFLVLNRFDKRINIKPERIAKNLHQEVVVSIPLEELVVDSTNRGVSFYLENKTSPISRSLTTLSELVKQHLLRE